MLEKRGVEPLFGVCKGVVVFVRRGCSGFEEFNSMICGRV